MKEKRKEGNQTPNAQPETGFEQTKIPPKGEGFEGNFKMNK